MRVARVAEEHGRRHSRIEVKLAVSCHGGLVEPSLLRDFQLRASEDPAKVDLELFCEACGTHICDAEHGDSLEVLASTALDHRLSCGCG